jgi:hypothetical protein
MNMICNTSRKLIPSSAAIAKSESSMSGFSRSKWRINWFVVITIVLRMPLELRRLFCGSFENRDTGLPQPMSAAQSDLHQSEIARQSEKIFRLTDLRARTFGDPIIREAWLSTNSESGI